MCLPNAFFQDWGTLTAVAGRVLCWGLTGEVLLSNCPWTKIIFLPNVSPSLRVVHMQWLFNVDGRLLRPRCLILIQYTYFWMAILAPERARRPSEIVFASASQFKFALCLNLLHSFLHQCCFWEHNSNKSPACKFLFYSSFSRKRKLQGLEVSHRSRL